MPDWKPTHLRLRCRRMRPTSQCKTGWSWVIEVEWNGTLKVSKDRPKQAVIAGLFVNMDSAKAVLAYNAIPRDSAEQGHYDREAAYQNVVSARPG